MPSNLWDKRHTETLASRRFTRSYLAAFGTAALIGLPLGVMWTIAGLLHFHPLW